MTRPLERELDSLQAEAPRSSAPVPFVRSDEAREVLESGLRRWGERCQEAVHRAMSGDSVLLE